MPLRDTLKAFKTEFDLIRNQVNQFTGQPHQNQPYPGQQQSQYGPSQDQQGRQSSPAQGYGPAGQGQHFSQQHQGSSPYQQQGPAPSQPHWSTQHQYGQPVPQQPPMQSPPPQGWQNQPSGSQYPPQTQPHGSWDMPQHQQQHQHAQGPPPPGNQQHYQSLPNQAQHGQYQQPHPNQWQQHPQPNQPHQQTPQQHSQQHLGVTSAPPPPYSSHPSSPAPPHPSPSPQPRPANPTTYWSAQFHPATPLSSIFTHKLGAGGWGNNELQTYTDHPRNSFVTPSGQLVLRAIAQSHHPDPAQRFTSARLVTHQTLARPRGRLTTTLTLPHAPGIWPAFWLLPREPFSWPADGEIDLAESWNAQPVNHSCLHWGHFTPQDAAKHRVAETPLPHLADPAHRVRFDFLWDHPDAQDYGRLLWLLDGRPVMRSEVPRGLRRLKDFTLVLNVAVGGDVCRGVRPRDGHYDLVVHDISMSAEPEGARWASFDEAWTRAREGKTM